MEIREASTDRTITAREVIDRIKNNVGVPWRDQTVDVIKGGGNGDTIVTGIVTTFMSTLDVLQKSVQAGKNFIITHEPTFWNNLDRSDGLTDNPLYLHKLAFIRRNGLVVWRFHDHWHDRRPDGIHEGFYAELGWDQYKHAETQGVFEMPEPTTLEALAKDIRKRLKSDSVRVVGDSGLLVHTVARGPNKLPGFVTRLPLADAFVVQEADRENDLVEWCRDTVFAGQRKGFIFVSHNRGEESGMDNCARWVRGFIPEVPVAFIPSGDPFWRTNDSR